MRDMLSPLGVLTRKFNPTTLENSVSNEIYYPELSPAITGYTFLYLNYIPTGVGTSQYTKYILSAMARGFTLPQISIDANTFNTYNPLSMPGKINIGTDLSIKLIDSTDLQMSQLFTRWVKAIRPMSNQDVAINSQMIRKIKPGLFVESYSTDMLIFTTDPGLNSVEYGVVLKGSWPTTIPMDILNIEISSVDAYSFTQNFKVKQTIPLSTDSKSLMYISEVILPNLRENYDSLS